VPELSDLLESKINAEDFFEENFITSDMKTLLEKIFSRLEGSFSAGGYKKIKIDVRILVKTHFCFVVSAIKAEPCDMHPQAEPGNEKKRKKIITLLLITFLGCQRNSAGWIKQSESTKKREVSRFKLAAFFVLHPIKEKG